MASHWPLNFMARPRLLKVTLEAQGNPRCQSDYFARHSHEKMSSASTDQRLEHLLTAVENEFQKGSEKGDVTERDIKLTLEDCELWTKFKELTNEMIVTKTGR